MRRLNWIALLSLLFFAELSIAQGEEIGPLMGIPSLQKDRKVNFKLNEGTLDSTFIYIQDTVTLPIFDDFSSNKFQTYADDFLTADSSQLIFRLEESQGTPYPNGTVFTTQQTFRQTWIVSTQTSVQTNFDDSTVYIGDLSTYPVSHIGTPVYPAYYILDTLDTPTSSDATPDTNFIVGPDIFQDSARQFFASHSEPNLYWIDHEAFHNYTFAFEPWSLGVVTFDGTDEFGYPYEMGSTTTNFADHLTSKPIDMSSYDAGDSVYFSFLVQREGFGDVPEETDSLILEFYAHDLQQWNQVWSTNGGTLNDFQLGHIRIESNDYFKNGFQFRFINWGSRAGSLDHFHLDYVHLRFDSGHQDTLFKDFAIVYPVTSLLNDYNSVPWEHYQNNFAGEMSNEVEVVVRNNSNSIENNEDGLIEVSYGGTPEGNFTLIAQTLSGGNINYDPRTHYYSLHDLSGGYHYDETKPGDQEVFEIKTSASAPFPNFAGNDSTVSEQVFSNYYAYDDGSAEAAYGPTGVQSRLAVQYKPYEADSLVGVQIHWVPSVNDVSNKLFRLTVWDDNNGVPGTVIYEDHPFFPNQPHYQYDRNIFTTYVFKDSLQDSIKVGVNGTFYVGWRQYELDRLNVGLDRNNANNEKTFYSIDGGVSWSSSSFEGSVMIRPIFSTALDYTLGLPQYEAKEPSRAIVYPNPTTGIVKIETEGNDYIGVVVLDASGRVIRQSKEDTVDISNFDTGIYFFQLNHSGESIKVIKQ